MIAFVAQTANRSRLFLLSVRFVVCECKGTKTFLSAKYFPKKIFIHPIFPYPEGKKRASGREEIPDRVGKKFPMGSGISLQPGLSFLHERAFVPAVGRESEEAPPYGRRMTPQGATFLLCAGPGSGVLRHLL